MSRDQPPDFYEMGEAIKAADPSMAGIVDEVTRAHDELGALMWRFSVPRCDICGEPWLAFIRFAPGGAGEQYCRKHAPPKDVREQ